MEAPEPISSNSFRYNMSENIQFSSLKNINILPQFSSHLYSYNGFGDFIADVPIQLDNKLYAFESSFSMDSSSLYTQQDQSFSDEAQAFCSSQSYFPNYESGPSSLMTTESLVCPSIGASYNPSNINHQQPSQLQKENDTNCSTRKRPRIEKKPFESEIIIRTSNKKRCCQEQLLQECQIHKEIIQIQREKVPVRRSQKLADKITALQKLVSPYGKTDTASVLHEASIFIKVLRDQIEKMLSSSPDKNSPQRKIGEKSFDLRNKGLCLVPISSTQKLMKEEEYLFNQYCSLE